MQRTTAVRAPAAPAIDPGWPAWDGALIALVGRPAAERIAAREHERGDRPIAAALATSVADEDGYWRLWLPAMQAGGGGGALAFNSACKSAIWQGFCHAQDEIDPARWRFVSGAGLGVEPSSGAALGGGLARVLIDAYMEEARAHHWRQIAQYIVARDFRANEIVRAAPAPVPQPVREGEPCRVAMLGRRTVSGLTIQVKAHGTWWGVTRERFIDRASLQDLARTAADAGRACSELVEDQVFSALRANVRPDGAAGAWFSTTNGTATAGAALTRANLDLDLAALRRQKVGDRYVGGGRVLLVVGSGQDRLARSTVDTSDERGRVTVLSSPRLSDGARFLIDADMSPVAVAGFKPSAAELRPETGRDPKDGRMTYGAIRWATVLDVGVAGVAETGIGAVYNAGA